MTLPEGMPESIGPSVAPEEVVWEGPADQPIVGGVFDDVTALRAKEIIARYPQSRSALLPLLHLVQSVEGHVSQDGIRFCADALELTTAEVSAVATFYTMFFKEPVGRHVVAVCHNLTCHLLGAKGIIEHLKDRLGVEPGVVQAVELPVEVDGSFAVPEQPNDLERLFEAADRSVEIEPVGYGVLGLAASESEDEPALGEMVDGQRALREQRGMSAHRIDDAGHQRHVRREHRSGGRDRHGVQVAVRRR